MSNLSNNTAQLEALLAKINKLPEAGGANTSDATATADEIFAGETAYTANGKVAGTFTIEEELTQQNNLISQISALVAQKANPPGGGSGGGTGGIETVTIVYEVVPEPMEEIYYIDGTMTLCHEPLVKNGTYEVVKNSILMVTGYTGNTFPSCTFLAGGGQGKGFFVTG